MRSNLLIIAFILFSLSSCQDDEKNPTSPGSDDEEEPKKVYIFSVTATPTENEQITIKNNSGIQKDISSWTLGDKNNPTNYSIPNSTILNQGVKKRFSHTTLGFQINDSGEIIYLKDGAGNTIDTWKD